MRDSSDLRYVLRSWGFLERECFRWCFSRDLRVVVWEVNSLEKDLWRSYKCKILFRIRGNFREGKENDRDEG